MSATLAAFDRPRIGPTNAVFKSGPLFISSKGLGWKSWKKRWFILTRTSLVFFKNDPSALPQRGGEVNLTLGGIDLNNSGSVVVREDKKLLTVLFPDGRDGRAFTLKAETSEDLYEWKTALEHALAQAPNASLVMGHNGIFRNDMNDAVDGPFHQWRGDKRPVKSLVVGRPILLALEDIDGGPSFLEKALRFLEKFGTKVEGILRLSADVEEVDRRVQEYEKGKTEFDADEDAHIIGDCVKPYSLSIHNKKLIIDISAFPCQPTEIDRKEARIYAMRAAIFETFPEPNRRLLQRILKMMHTISSHASVNRMTASAVAACMAPLLLRPLLTGECELEDDLDFAGDSSVQLLAAANAANNAQAIVTILLEEYENIFDHLVFLSCRLAIQRLEIAKNDLRHRIAKEARGNAILQASLERRKEALHERRLALEQDVSRLQEQLQAERDLRAALEVGLSMSSGQFTSSRGMDSKTRAELEEIALAEADVARLKQKVAELHHQLNQQRQHHYGAFPDVHAHYPHIQNSKPQQKFHPQDFDTTLAHVNHERKQRTEESSLSADWRNIKGQVLTSSNVKHLPRKQALEHMNTSDSRSTEASPSVSADELCANDSASVPSSSRIVEPLDYHRHPSSALVELTTRLDFFKERRSQLMEQLHNLDLNYGSSSSAQDFAYRPSSPPWS
uniref:Uncharacterized protein n=1 Tax=Kalanchoe fedtschenkoi TaxID=63787 RepID=A0A7N0TIN8_KALFE